MRRQLKTRVLLADDHPTTLWALKNILEMSGQFNVIAEAMDGEQCIEMHKKYDPQLLLLDLDIPVVNGFEVLKKLAGINEKLKILVMSSCETSIYTKRLRKLGAKGFIHKTANSDIIISACIAVSQGYSFFHSEHEQVQELADDEILSNFSVREFQILKYLSDGYRNHQISDTLHISAKTVATYKQRIFRKTSSKNIAELIAFCRTHNISNV